MTRQIRFPGIVDVIRTDDPDTIRTLASHAALDRGFEPRGPLVNRLLAGRVRRALRSGDAPLPSALMRDDADRKAEQARLRETFAAGNWDDATVEALAEYVRGRDTRPVGELAQEVIGLVFTPTYNSDEEVWDAATKVEFHLRSWNPVLRLVRWLSGELYRAQKILTRAADGNAAAVHGTGVAVHNLVQSLDWLRSARADAGRARRLTPVTAARASLQAPQTVVRAGAYSTDLPGGTVSPGTIVALDTRKAASRAMDTDLAFLGSSWSRCPADVWVVALLEEVWRRSGEARS